MRTGVPSCKNSTAVPSWVAQLLNGIYRQLQYVLHVWISSVAHSPQRAHLPWMDKAVDYAARCNYSVYAHIRICAYLMRTTYNMRWQLPSIYQCNAESAALLQNELPT